jgi:ankyrin repeat protein
MPDRPDLDRFRQQARALQGAVRAGDPAAVARVDRQHPGAAAGDPGSFRLSTAQLVVAREYGFASWPRLRRYLDVVAEYGWDNAQSAVPASDPAAEFCRLACLTYTREDGPDRWARARGILTEHPGLTRASIWAAAAAGRPDDVRRLLAEQPGRAVERGGPWRWRPLCYLAYSRVDPQVPADAVLSVARQLLAAGADPNEGYLFTGLSPAFTLLTGVFGSGELGPRRQPSHPHWRPLARLLLDAGADPNDAQALYNRMFASDNEHLELLFGYGLGRGDGGPWKARAGHLVDGPAVLLRTQLRWAVEHNQAERVRLLVEHGVDFRSAYLGDGPAWRPGDGRTPAELARLNGYPEIADYLVAQGAPAPDPDPVSDLIAAVLRADVSTVEQIRAEHPEVVSEARRSRPGLIVWAAARAPVRAVELLVELGFEVNALGRADAPVEEPWETALHHSAGTGDLGLTRRLLELGADRGIRDKRFDATPLDWARHLNQHSTAELLEPPG